MNWDGPQVKQALAVIRSAPFTATDHRLLFSFVKDSVNPEVTATYVLKRVSEGDVESEVRCLLAQWKTLVEMFRNPRAPPLLTSQSVVCRDRGLCCLTGRSRFWWDIFGWSKTTVTPIVPEGILLISSNSANASYKELLSLFIGDEQVQSLQSILSDTTPKGSCRKHWTLSRDAAIAFSGGLHCLLPGWHLERHPEEDLKPKCRYKLGNTMPNPTSSLTTINGLQLQQFSAIEMATGDAVNFPLPSAFLFSIHKRFINSIRSLQIEHQMSSQRPPSAFFQWISKIRNACFAKVFPGLRLLWSYFPRQGRIWVYRLLLHLGSKLYKQENLWTQRVPFGLYIKHGKGKLIPKGEGSALRLVEEYTSILAPKLVETLVDGDYTYLVMTRLPGKPLMQSIYTMSHPERTRLATDLAQCVSQLASVPNKNEASICSADGGPVFDYRIDGRSAGPFNDETAFNGCIVTQDRLRSPSHDRRHKICFTHADLNPNNILIQSGRLSGLVDFGCAGFYPAYWEFTKAMFSTPGLDPSFVDLFMETFGDTYQNELDAEKKLWRVRNPF